MWVDQKGTPTISKKHRYPNSATLFCIEHHMRLTSSPLILSCNRRIIHNIVIYNAQGQLQFPALGLAKELDKFGLTM